MNTSTNLATALAHLKKIETEEQLAETNLAIMQKASHEQKNHIKFLVRNGATTGDEVRDYLIARNFSFLNEEQERMYRRINKRMAGKTGELVMFLTYETRRMYGPRDEHRTEVQFHLAVLRGEKLRFTAGEHPSCTLPIDSYAILNRHVMGEKKYEITRKPYAEGFTGHFELLQGICRKHERPSSKLAIAVLPGTKEVRSLVQYEYLTLLEEDTKRLHQLEKDLGLFELEAQVSE